MSIFRRIEKLIYPNSQRQDTESERARRRRIRNKIKDIERLRTDYVYGDQDELEQIARHFAERGQHVERYFTSAIKIDWK